MSSGLAEDYEDDLLDTVEIGTVDYDGPIAPPIIRRADAPAQKAQRKPLTLKPFILGVKTLIVIGAILAYPASVMLSHQIDDTQILLDSGRHWAAGDIGVSATLLGRELDGPGWAADRHPWHPQAQLTALPAWQEGLRASIADHARLTLGTLEGQRDQDLVAAERLLASDDSLKATPRLQAAREALMRYDERVGRGVAGSPQGLGFLKQEMQLTLGWAAASSATLADISTPGDGWLASSEAVSAVYYGKARAHAAHELLSAVRIREGSNLIGHPAASALDLALARWRSAAKLKPLFVSNQGGDGLIGANHPAILALRLSEAHAATEQALTLLEAGNGPPIDSKAP
jgi:hypothetical protein